MITIVDYGMGNLGSIKNMLKNVGHESIITGDPIQIKNSGKIILPGVGSFDKAIENLKLFKLIDILNRKALVEKVPVLGICLGMQLMAIDSEEGKLEGFGWIDGHIKRFNLNKNFKIPHMGWNQVLIKKEHFLFEQMFEAPRFYFVHSYYFQCNNSDNIIATTKYGIEFDSVVYKENIMGVQFHPEKSHKYGMKILENFAKF